MDLDWIERKARPCQERARKRGGGGPEGERWHGRDWNRKKRQKVIAAGNRAVGIDGNRGVSRTVRARALMHAVCALKPLIRSHPMLCWMIASRRF